jgi:hypothetical protein
VTLPTNGSSSTGGWAAVRPGDGETAYHIQSLRHQPVELALDESVPRYALLSLFVRSAAVAFGVWCVFLVIWFLGALSSFSNNSTPNSSLLSIGSAVSFFTFWFVLLFSRTNEPIAEWRALLEDKAAAAVSAYAAIYGSLRRRRIPLNAVPTRVRSDVLLPEAVNNRLVITERGYSAYVSVFPYGTSLYIGWLMFRSRRGISLILTALKDVLGSILGRTDIVSQMLRTEKVRAMREAVHSAAREGVDIAIQGIEVPMMATFGYDVPVQDLDAPPASPAPGMPGARPAPAPAPLPAPAPTPAPQQFEG